MFTTQRQFCYEGAALQIVPVEGMRVGDGGRWWTEPEIS